VSELADAAVELAQVDLGQMREVRAAMGDAGVAG
jgi:hypothetical protein